MDELLTPVSTTYRKSTALEEPLFRQVKISSPNPSVSERPPEARIQVVTSLDQVIEILKSQPGYDTLIAGLRFLGDDETGGRLSVGPKSASAIQLLVAEIGPNYWPLLSEGSLPGNDDVSESLDPTTTDAELYLRCLRNITGLNALLSQIKAFVLECKSISKGPARPDIDLQLSLLLQILAAVLAGDRALRTIWLCSIAGLASTVHIKVQQQIFTSIVVGGRLQSVAAEAHSCIEAQAKHGTSRWISDGTSYTRWAARNIVAWALSGDDEHEALPPALFQRAMTLGYPETLIKTVADLVLLVPDPDSATFLRICLQQSSTSKKVIHVLLNYFSGLFLGSLELKETAPNRKVSAVASLLQDVVGRESTNGNILIDWCCSLSGAGLGDGIGVRRAVMAVLAQNKDHISTVFEKSLSQFGDELYIKHTPLLQQEVHTQILLLSAGYVRRISPIKLTMAVRSSSYLQAISNRIAAAQVKARFLGMVVGESLSALIDDKKQKLDFHMEEMDTDQAQWLKGLTRTSDDIGSSRDLLRDLASKTPMPPTREKRQVKVSKASVKPTVTSLPPKGIIEEIDSSDDEEDLKPYVKGSDPEDSDEDPSLVQRNKVRPPVYIRTLIEYFRDSESYDKQKLALETSPSLIRRKANYGVEVRSHAEELASLLAGVQDKFEIENFLDLRLQGMISLLVAQPTAMGPWYARTFFEGDYSLSQRTAVLVALGLSARELAGFEVSAYKTASEFPSKKLPGKIEHFYGNTQVKDGETRSTSNLKALPPTALHQIADSLTRNFLEPIAAEAADASTGPNALKLETFSARYKSKSKSKPRVRSIPNTTAALLAASFFSPLTAHFTVAIRSSKPLILNPALLSLYLQTLGVVIHAAGPSTISLPQLTSELWDLLLSVRVHALEDLGSTRGWLIALAAMLEVNEADMRRLCESQGREMLETREWVSGIFERTRGEDGGEENEVKMLAAGILIRLGEALEQHQNLMMGNMLGFS